MSYVPPSRAYASEGGAYVIFMQMNKFYYILAVIIFGIASCSRSDDELILVPEKEILSTSRCLFESTGGETVISVFTDEIWELTAQPPDWLQIQYESESSFRLIAEPNFTESERRVNLRVRSLEKYYILTVTQKAKGYLRFINDSVIVVSADADKFTVGIESNVDYSIEYLDNGNEWIKKSTLNHISIPDNPQRNVKFEVSENQSDLSRSSRLVIRNEILNLCDTLTVFQNGRVTDSMSDIYTDGDVFCIQKSAIGNINLIFMGDGFTSQHMTTGGHYESSIKKAVDYFFSIEPYSTYKDYFNIYMVVAESDTDKIGDKYSSGMGFKYTKFQTAYGSGTEIVCNDEIVFEYAMKVPELDVDNPYFVIVIVNDDKYAGTCYLYPEGKSIALCPMSTKPSPQGFEDLVHHEAGGHGFGFLVDEYVYYQSEIPQSSVEDIKQWQKSGFYLNVDFTPDLDKIIWNGFVGLDGYEMVGAYEGADKYQFGVWRCEENSCMNNNIPYYNVQSRWIIYKKIMELSGCEYSREDFLKNDNADYTEDVLTRTLPDDFIPLSEPKVIYSN